MAYISKPKLDTKETAGNVGQPQYGSFPMGADDFSADTSNSETSLNQDFSHENRSAKWKGGSQDIPSKAANQYQ